MERRAEVDRRPPRDAVEWWLPVAQALGQFPWPGPGQNFKFFLGRVWSFMGFTALLHNYTKKKSSILFINLSRVIKLIIIELCMYATCKNKTLKKNIFVYNLKLFKLN